MIFVNAIIHVAFVVLAAGAIFLFFYTMFCLASARGRLPEIIAYPALTLLLLLAVFHYIPEEVRSGQPGSFGANIWKGVFGILFVGMSIMFIILTRKHRNPN